MGSHSHSGEATLLLSCMYFLSVTVTTQYEGAPVAQWVKRRPTDLAVPSSSPARG